MLRSTYAGLNRLAQYNLQLVQVFFVGLTLGMVRTVVPAVAESDFGVRTGDLALVSTFVVAFGLVKGVMNFIAGAASESLGRRRVLIIGWIIALPIPWMIWQAPADGGWWWIVAATALLGVNQGLTWSMTLTSKLDLTRRERRGFTNGLNEFSGYLAVAIAGVMTAYLAQKLGVRIGLLWFGYASIVPALLMAVFFVSETRKHDVKAATVAPPHMTSARAVLIRSCTEARLLAICQCGMIEKFIDCLVWIALPIALLERGVQLEHIGWIPGIYATSWGVLQIITGPLSDRVGRLPLIVGGMLLCALSAVLMPVFDSLWMWGVCACVMGVGMAMLYPTLGAAVSDLADASWRGTALGVYRLWRDWGYAVGAAMIGLTTMLGFSIAAAFFAVGAFVAVSGVATALMLRSGPLPEESPAD